MNYSKIGPVSDAVVKVAKLKGYNYPKLMVKEWGETRITLDLVVFKQDFKCAKHRLLNDDDVYEAYKSLDAKDINFNTAKGVPVFEVVTEVVYDRISTTYKEKVKKAIPRLEMLVDTEDPHYDEFVLVLDQLALQALLLDREDMRREQTLVNRNLSIMDKRLSRASENVAMRKFEILAKEINEKELSCNDECADTDEPELEPSTSTKNDKPLYRKSKEDTDTIDIDLKAFDDMTMFFNRYMRSKGKKHSNKHSKITGNAMKTTD